MALAHSAIHRTMVRSQTQAVIRTKSQSRGLSTLLNAVRQLGRETALFLADEIVEATMDTLYLIRYLRYQMQRRENGAQGHRRDVPLFSFSKIYFQGSYSCTTGAPRRMKMAAVGGRRSYVQESEAQEIE